MLFSRRPLPVTTTRDVLLNARALVARRHVTGDLAFTDAGERVFPTDPRATGYCAAGGLYRAARGRSTQLDTAVCALMRAAGLEFQPERDRDAYRTWPIGQRNLKAIGTWHDNASHAEVLAVFDKAIAECDQPAAPVPGLEEMRAALEHVATADEARAIALAALELADAFTAQDLATVASPR